MFSLFFFKKKYKTTDVCHTDREETAVEHRQLDGVGDGRERRAGRAQIAPGLLGLGGS